MNEKHTEPVRLAESELGRHRHACAFFHSEEEEYRVLLPFVQEGLERGDKAFQILGAEPRQERLRRLEEAGIDVSACEGHGQLEVRAWEDPYLRGERLDQEAMVAFIEEAISKGEHKRLGRLTRFWANLPWAVQDRPRIDDILEFESRLNYVLPKYDDVVVCSFDLARHDATFVTDIMRTHPLVIIGGILQENPFYVPPDEMLKELRERAGSKGG